MTLFSTWEACIYLYKYYLKILQAVDDSSELVLSFPSEPATTGQYRLAPIYFFASFLIYIGKGAKLV